MSLSIAPTEKDILARLNTLAPEFYDTEVPQGLVLPVSNGLIKPYGVVFFGGPIRSSRDHHITSSRNDTTTGFCTVQVQALQADVVRTINDQVIELLTGYYPVNAGEMILAGSMGYSDADEDTGAQWFYRETGFTYAANLVWSA